MYWRVWIRSAALVATENAQKSVGATVTLQANREQAFQQRSSSSDSDDQSTRPDPGSFQSTPVAITDAQAIADLDGVASYSFEVSTSADAVSGMNRSPAVTHRQSQKQPIAARRGKWTVCQECLAGI